MRTVPTSGVHQYRVYGSIVRYHAFHLCMLRFTPVKNENNIEWSYVNWVYRSRSCRICTERCATPYVGVLVNYAHILLHTLLFISNMRLRPFFHVFIYTGHVYPAYVVPHVTRH